MTTEQKEQFEGDRVEYRKNNGTNILWFNDIRICGATPIAQEEELDAALQALADAFNNQSTLRKEMIELSDRIVELEKNEETLKDIDNGITSHNQKLEDEIARLREENANLQSKLSQALERAQSFKERIEQITAGDPVVQENIRLREEILAADKRVQEAEDRVIEKQKRVKELETPDSWQVVDSDSSSEVLEDEISRALDGFEDEDGTVIECWPFHHLPKKHVAAKYNEEDYRWESIGEFDTLEEAKAALKSKGE